MDAIKNKRIAIVGGGPGGLTLARLLQRKGAIVKVYERDLNKDVRVQGATLDLHEESGLKALEQAGLMDAFRANYRPGADKMRIINKHGQIILDEHVNAGNEMFRPEIDRGPLRKMLLESLQPDTVVWDSHFSGMKKVNGVWQLEFQNRTSALADIVIAADGANSKIRPLVTPIRPFYSGITIVEGSVPQAATVVPQLSELLNGGKLFVMDDEKTLIVSSKGDGSLVFYTGCKTGEHWCQESGIDFSDKQQVIHWFRQEFSGWDPSWTGLFEHAAHGFIPRPQYCMPEDQRWEPQADLTLLGDAAHLMPPYAGEGVNMAMQDALELSECLTNGLFEDTRTAIAHYEQHMLMRASEVIKVTLAQTASLHSANATTDMMAMFNGED